MKKKLNSVDHKIKRDSVNFQRGNILEQTEKTAKVTDSGKSEVKDALLLNEKQDKLLVDILDILYRGDYGKYNAMTMEMYLGNSIVFGYLNHGEAQNKYEKILHFFEKEFSDKTITKKENGGFIFKTTSGHMSIDVDYNKDRNDDISIGLSGSFTGKAIEKARKEYGWFDNSRSRYEEKEKKEEEKKEEDYQKRYKEDYRKRYEERQDNLSDEETVNEPEYTKK